MGRHLALGACAYCVVALIQIPAVISGIHQLTGSWFFSVPLGLMFGSTPLFGSALGIEGAEGSWGWSAGESYSLFIGVPLFFLGAGALIGIAKIRAAQVRTR